MRRAGKDARPDHIARIKQAHILEALDNVGKTLPSQREAQSPIRPAREKTVAFAHNAALQTAFSRRELMRARAGSVTPFAVALQAEGDLQNVPILIFFTKKGVFRK